MIKQKAIQPQVAQGQATVQQKVFTVCPSTEFPDVSGCKALALDCGGTPRVVS